MSEVQELRTEVDTLRRQMLSMTQNASDMSTCIAKMQGNLATQLKVIKQLREELHEARFLIAAMTLDAYRSVTPALEVSGDGHAEWVANHFCKPLAEFAEKNNYQI